MLAVTVASLYMAYNDVICFLNKNFATFLFEEKPLNTVESSKNKYKVHFIVKWCLNNTISLLWITISLLMNLGIVYIIRLLKFNQCIKELLISFSQQYFVSNYHGDKQKCNILSMLLFTYYFNDLSTSTACATIVTSIWFVSKCLIVYVLWLQVVK